MIHVNSIATIQDRLADAMNVFSDRMNNLADALAAGEPEDLSAVSAVLRDLVVANGNALTELLMIAVVLADAVGQPDLIEGDGVDVHTLR